MKYKEIEIDDVLQISELYVATFNSPPWNDKWTMETASKRLSQIIKSEGFYGLMAFQDGILGGLILGNKEQYFNGVMFNIKEFCVNNELRGQGLGTLIFEEFENRLIKMGIKEIILFTTRDECTEGFYHRRGVKTYNNLVMMGKQLF